MGSMRPFLPRREFLKHLGRLGAACAGGCLAIRAIAGERSSGDPAPPRKLPDLRARAYCGLICNDQCPLFKATKDNDAAAKRKVYDQWRWKDRFGVEFNPDVVFCHGCKAPGKPRNIAKAHCTVLKCSTERGLESCLQCRKLAACDQELWKNYPEFQKQMVRLQQEYAATEGFTLS